MQRTLAVLALASRAMLSGALAPARNSSLPKSAKPWRRPLGLTALKTKIPITEKVTMGTMFGRVTSTGDEIRYNECLPYPVEVSPSDQMVEVCGAGTRVVIFLRGRCEDYSYYIDEVGHCGSTTQAAAESCMTTSSAETNHWLGHAQSNWIEQCGAVAGEVSEKSGPSCSGLEDCMNQVTEQAKSDQKAAKEAAELKKLGIEVDEHGAPMMGGKKKRLKGKFTGRARAAAGRKSRAAARMEETKFQRQASAAIGDALKKKAAQR